jgi:Cytochrome C and Quinol oxidase polypeptide I/GIY-YIG catalytic domain/NUMOD1 domain
MLKSTYLKLITHYNYRRYQTKSYSNSNDNNEDKHDNIKDMITNITMWKERWFLSSNAKDIGTLYLMFALFSGLIGTAFSVLIRLELSGPGVQYIADNQLYNSIITAHAILMIFFMVNKLQILNLSIVSYIKNSQNIIKVENFSLNNNNSGDSFKSKYNYTKVIIENPYNNRDIIAKITKKQKGVYVWETLDGKNLYVGHSINLYNRICSYFMPSILKTKEKRVLRYLNKYGFTNIKLTVYILNNLVNLKEVIELEQHFIDSLKPNLNVDLVANGSGYHEPMKQEIRERLRKQRGTPIFMYNANNFTLLYIFDSKTFMYNSINIHHKTLEDCLYSGKIYLDTYFFSLEQIEESTDINLLTLNEIKILVSEKRKIYQIKHPASKAILAEFKDDYSLNKKFKSLNFLAKELKGDRQVIREYLKGNKSGYYRGKWKFTYIETK